jgi:hypothetical protein
VVFEEVGLLLLVDIEPGVADLPALEAADEGRRLDQTAARRVDEHDAALHLGDGLVVDHVSRRVEQRQVERDDVRLGQELVELDVLGVLLLLHRVVLVDVVAQHRAPEPDEDVDQATARARARQRSITNRARGAGQGGLHSDLAGADDAHGLAVNVKAEQSLQRKVALPRAVVRPMMK